MGLYSDANKADHNRIKPDNHAVIFHRKIATARKFPKLRFMYLEFLVQEEHLSPLGPWEFTQQLPLWSHGINRGAQKLAQIVGYHGYK